MARGRKAIKTRCGGRWTEARYVSFVKSALRSASRKWAPTSDVLNEAYVGVMKNKKTGRMAKHYRCAYCEGLFPHKEVAVDHEPPIVSPEEGFTTWDDFINRLFCEADGLQVLCKTCHDEKSNEEKARAAEARRNG